MLQRNVSTYATRRNRLSNLGIKSESIMISKLESAGKRGVGLLSPT